MSSFKFGNTSFGNNIVTEEFKAYVYKRYYQFMTTLIVDYYKYNTTKLIKRVHKFCKVCLENDTIISMSAERCYDKVIDELTILGLEDDELVKPLRSILTIVQDY